MEEGIDRLPGGGEAESKLPSGEQSNAIDLGEMAVLTGIAKVLEGFSGFADNYVATKIGLELKPNSPEYVLIAAIAGGRLTAIGNMANPVGVPFGEYSLKDSLARVGRHGPSSAFFSAYSNLVHIAAKRLAFLRAPKPIN